MTTFAVVQYESVRLGTLNSGVLKAVRVKDDVSEDELEKRADIRKRNRRSRKNDVLIDIHSRDYRSSLYKSQIGLIYLKPIVGYSTSVYFHAKRECNEGNRIEDHNSRYARHL